MLDIRDPKARDALRGIVADIEFAPARGLAQTPWLRPVGSACIECLPTTCGVPKYGKRVRTFIDLMYRDMIMKFQTFGLTLATLQYNASASEDNKQGLINPVKCLSS
jgi:hypothetical protein